MATFNFFLPLGGGYLKPFFNFTPSSVAARPGFEPELDESKSSVLPLHHQAITELNMVPLVGCWSR